jgi:translation initiation factor IF-1
MDEKTEEKAEEKPEKINKGGGKQKEEGFEIEGIVTEALKGKFRIRAVPEGEQIDPDNLGIEVLGHLAGKLRKHYIKIVPGDRVKVEVSPYDLTRGRITFRMKK